MVKDKDNININFRKETSNMLKGALAIAIVLHHLSERTTTIGIIDFFEKLGSPMVAIFFFISGYGLLSSLLANREKYLEGFFKKRFSRLLVPFLLSIVLFQIFSLLDGNQLNVKLIFQNFIYRGDTNLLLPFSWYIFVIICLYLMFFFVYRNINISLLEGIFLVVSLSAGLIYFLQIINFRDWWYISILGFSFGLFCKYFEGQIEKLVQSKYLIVFALFTLLLIKLFGKYHYASMCLYPFLIFLFFNKVYISNIKLFLFLGNISYEIYLVQGISIFFLRGNFIFISNNYLYIILTFAITIVLAFLLNKLSSIILKKV